MDDMFRQIAATAANIGPEVLVSNWPPFRRPMDVVKAPALSVDDKRTILAAWASDFYAIDSKPALRHIPGTPSRFQSMRFSLPCESSIRGTIPDGAIYVVSHALPAFRRPSRYQRHVEANSNWSSLQIERMPFLEGEIPAFAFLLSLGYPLKCWRSTSQSTRLSRSPPFSEPTGSAAAILPLAW